MAGDEALRTPEEQSESNVIGSSLHMPPDNVEAARLFDIPMDPVLQQFFEAQRELHMDNITQNEIYIPWRNIPIGVHLTRRNTQNGVHMTRRNSPQNPSNSMSFMEAVVSNAKKINLTSLYILLFTCGTITVHLAKQLTSQFILKLGNSYSATQALSIGETFQEFHIEIAYELAIMLVFLLSLLLSCPRPLFVVFIVSISFVGLFLYIPNLVGNTHGTVVTCGLFMLPLLCFTTLVALVLSLMFVSLALFFSYLIYRCANGTGGSIGGGELDIDMEDLPMDVEEGIN